MDLHEVAGGLRNKWERSLGSHAPDPSAREANLVSTLHGGFRSGIGLGRLSKQGKEVQRPQ